MRGLLRRLGADPSGADDLAQQVFLQAWTRLAALRAPGAFGGWLKQIAVNTWLAQVRLKTPRFVKVARYFEVSSSNVWSMPAAPPRVR